MTAARTADGVSATWTPQCTGTTVGTYRGDPAIRSRPGWRCDVEVKILNRASHSIHVAHLETPFLGTDGGAEVRGFSTRDATIRDANAPADGPAPRFGDVDAVYDVDLAIPAHASRTVSLAIGWREDGCNAGGTLWFDHWPSVVFETLHRTFRYMPDQKFVLRTYDDAHDRTACADTAD
jgi:hypothetical protein